MDLPWQSTPGYSVPNYDGMNTNTPGGYNQNNLLQALMKMQPSAPQSIASAVPFYNLPKQQMAYMQPSIDMTHAMTDITSPQYQQIYGQQKQQGQQNLAESIQEMSNQNRKLASMGRVPMFDPERGGEQLFRGVTKGYQDVQNTAANNTQNILGRAASNLNTIGQQQGQFAANKAGISGNLLGALTKLFNL